MCSMKQVTAKLSTYTADVSGVCSALFELGGMTVIHDPSGCNSTYNTHDEPRWYSHDSLVFISGLAQMDAILGNDEKWIRDIVRAAKDLKPAFIALVRTPVPLLTGTDFEGIAAEIEERTGIPAFHFPTTGMQTYIRGVGMALEAVAERLVSRENSRKTDYKKSPEISVNILGATPLDFSVGPTIASLKKWLHNRGFKTQCCMAMGSSLSEICSAGMADVSLVISSSGLPAAKVLKKRFGIPYVVGFPVEEFGDELNTHIIRTVKGCGCPQQSLDKQGADKGSGKESCVILGEPVTSVSLARALAVRKEICSRDITVISPLETDPELIQWSRKMGIACLNIQGEADLTEALRSFRQIIADPIYREVCPENISFIPMPHEAFSGRIYRKQIPDLVNVFIDNRF